ncbi:hypothetical protein LSTR_LSTR011084 [Laodelphax striatellus]|uniref:Uncharacterized protein n=1 Tax=Laodelphax striatellus TaxID=195883 RepID=A0A482WUQ4_LAOST|nr:hypothetical protein LSTR_LSTR011084 [Laodelphax striatellus]
MIKTKMASLEISSTALGVALLCLLSLCNRSKAASETSNLEKLSEEHVVD